jgi:hypothetical protein
VRTVVIDVVVFVAFLAATCAHVVGAVLPAQGAPESPVRGVRLDNELPDAPAWGLYQRPQAGEPRDGIPT